MIIHPLQPPHDTKRASHADTTMAVVSRLLGFGVLAAGLVSQPGFAVGHAANAPLRANFAQESASQDARHIADWIVDSNDNGKLPFLVVDKKNAKVFVFDAAGQLQAAAPVLLGTAYGDDSTPGIGQRKLASIPADERTTPAGRFVGHLGHNLNGVGILWVDYDAAISLHRVVTSNPKQRRAQRLTSPTVADNRISSGCINVPKSFYEQFVQTIFRNTNGIIYVLPETRSIDETFGSYNVGEHVRYSTLSAPVQIQDKTLPTRIIKLR